MSKHLTQLHEIFISKARRPMSLGRLPVSPVKSQVPIIPVDKWVRKDGALLKTYKFIEKSQRNVFINEMLEHEVEVGHSPIITVKGEEVRIKLTTFGTDSVTELDVEFSKWIDGLYKEVVIGVKSANDRQPDQ